MTFTQRFALAAPPEGRTSFLSRLRPFGRRLFSLPGLRAIRPWAQRVMAMAEPIRHVSLRRWAGEGGGQGCQPLTIMSANLWHDWPRYRGQSERLESFARLVESRQVDVLLLQEVARTPHLRVDEWLAERLDMAFVYSRANGHEDAIGFEEGLGVFSRFPLSTPHLRQLSPGGDSFVRRMALGATLATPCGEVLAVSAHLSLRRKRNAAQVAHLREWVESLADSRLAVVGGDFNASEESEQITQTQGVWVDAFRHLHPDAEDATHVVRWPWGGILRQSRLDYVFFHPGRGDWKVMEASHLSAASQPHSDHRAVFARLLWEPCGGLPEVTLH